MHHLLAIAVVFLASVPPAAKVLAFSTFIYGLLQIAKKSAVLAPYITGWKALALNGLLSLLGLVVTIPADQLYSWSTWATTITTWATIMLTASGIHGTVKLTSQNSSATGDAEGQQPQQNSPQQPPPAGPQPPAAAMVDHRRRNLLRHALAYAMLLLVLPAGTLTLTGCPAQTTLAALTTTLGNAAASIATIEGNPALAQQLQTDTAAATTAIQNWKPGTPAGNVVQALQIVESDLNLISQIPGAQQYAPLIALAVSTAISIIEIVDPGSAPQAVERAKAIPGVTTTGAPKTAKEFKTRWNGICASNVNLAKAAIK